MSQVPVLSSIWQRLTTPGWPRTALSINETHLALTTLRKRGAELEPSNLGVLCLPKGLVRAHFSEPNITSEADLLEKLRETMAQAGHRRLRRVAVALPACSARSLVFTLENVPNDRRELAQMIEWKVERSLGVRISELRIQHRRLSDFNGRSQWLVSAVHEQVLAQYERVFRKLGWQPGLILSQTLGEAQWLMRADLPDDQALVSLRDDGFDAVIVRGTEPILVREVNCSPEEREDEFFRLLVFYRDRLMPEEGQANLARLLTLGSVYEQRRFREVLAAALENVAVLLDPAQIGLRVEPSAPFKEFAAAAGLATLAWND
jgi:Tfp pilus assembly PilM family ATPase